MYNIIAIDRDGRKLTIFRDIKNIQSAENMRDWFKGRCCTDINIEIIETSTNEQPDIQD